MTDQESSPLPLEPESEEPEQQEEEANSDQESARRGADLLHMDIPAPSAGGAPPWVKIPEGFTFPRGKQVLFLRFKSSWTDAPWKGEPVIDPTTGEQEVDEHGNPVLYRQCIVWPINVADKKLALGRAQRDPNRAGDELTKQMIRAHDGVTADWAVVRTNGVEMFWNEIGEKCRLLLNRVFSRLHVLDTDSTRDFLANCIEVRSTGS